ncbi:MAG: hypothetical protein K2W96_28255 [Gemmataceae bacterium]|nr:hypothetical protein [Gemmataceae bacterium]
MSRCFAPLAIAAGLASIGLAGWMLWPAPAPAPGGLEAVDAVADLGELPIERAFTVTTRLRNTSRRPARILHLGSGCVPGCCFRPLDDAPVEVPPGGTASYSWEIALPEAGPFESQVPLFVDDGGLRTIMLTVRGKGVGGPTDAPK